MLRFFSELPIFARTNPVTGINANTSNVSFQLNMKSTAEKIIMSGGSLKRLFITAIIESLIICTSLIIRDIKIPFFSSVK
jgi:hypothetical protein